MVFTRDYQHVRKAIFLNIMSSLSESQELEELDVGNVNPALAVSRSLMTHVKLKTDVLNFDREKAMNEVSKSALLSMVNAKEKSFSNSFIFFF